MRTIFLASALSCALCGPAIAAGQVSCTVDDETAKMALESGLAQAGQRFFDFRGGLALKPAGVPEKLRTMRFDKTNLAQSWLDGRDLRIKVYTEAGRGDAFVSAEIIVTAKAAKRGSGAYRGSYTVAFSRKTAPDASKDAEQPLSGAISCSTR